VRHTPKGIHNTQRVAHQEGGRGGGESLKPVEEPVSSSAQGWTLGCSELIWSSEGWKVGVGDEKGDRALDGSIFLN
jgi:hypothetical protein